MQPSLVRYDYRISLAQAQPDRLIFTEEAFRGPTDENWQYLGSGHTEAKIVEEISPYAPLANYRFTTQFYRQPVAELFGISVSRYFRWLELQNELGCGGQQSSPQPRGQSGGRAAPVGAGKTSSDMIGSVSTLAGFCRALIVL